MLNTSRVEANVPAADLGRARAFYAEKLGMTPTREVGGVALRYETRGGTTFNVYETAYAGQAGHTIAQWHVDDIEAEVRDLKAKGVTFEVYDLPGVRWDGDIASMEGMARAAWFKDSEGNIMCIDQETATSP
ncbi:VOC family protein [Blastococcus sp. TML/M2B]|uniref:VOC family protein n=1 Tax=unclassified Blastococcus TaxID=2619396 RepID=UPI00190931D0|nr:MULTISPECIES: VOC family protein [unclassified Blastococcus]MBN1092846.1 VOC family protein [Blastococcus sp. TML/M2B]MBN1097043.1 VOC family protein [Blastococcus sp. TML/C7B]